MLRALMMFVAVMGVVYIFTSPDFRHDCQIYNEMRSIWDESQGAYCWPQYQDGKDEECGYESR